MLRDELTFCFEIEFCNQRKQSEIKCHRSFKPAPRLKVLSIRLRRLTKLLVPQVHRKWDNCRVACVKSRPRICRTPNVSEITIIYEAGSMNVHVYIRSIGVGEKLIQFLRPKSPTLWTVDSGFCG